MARTIDQHCNTALDFLNTLSPWDGLFPADYRQNYIFRGVGSAEYRLIPSAFRDGTTLRHFEQRVKTPCATLGDQIRAEISTIWEFFLAADRQGLRLPEDSQDLRTTLKEYASVDESLFEAIEKGETPWPPNHLISLMALAQHYGVPTRLLDWTFNPYIAAYFAAISMKKDSEKICVWALPKVHSEIQELLTDSRDRRLHLVSAPASDNQNLRAQRWVGLLYRHCGVSLKEPLVHRAYDDLADTNFAGDVIFFRATLPAEESGELLRLLSILDIDGSTVFPGFGGAARVVDEMSRWPEQEQWRQSSRLATYWRAQVDFWKEKGLYGLNDAENSSR